MDIKDTKDMVIRALRSDPMTKNVKLIDNSIVVELKDDTIYSLDIKLPLIFYRNYNEVSLDNNEQDVKRYYDTHTEEEFIQDILNMKKQRPGIFYPFVVLRKFVELGIISSDMSRLILLNAESKEEELCAFFMTLISEYQS